MIDPVDGDFTIDSFSKADSKRVPTYRVARALAAVTALDFDLNMGRLLREAKTLLKKGDAATIVALLEQHFGASGWWYVNDWRGKKQQRPTLSNIREVWGRWNDTAKPTVTYAAWEL